LSPEYHLDVVDARVATVARPGVYARAAEVAQRLAPAGSSISAPATGTG